MLERLVCYIDTWQENSAMLYLLVSWLVSIACINTTCGPMGELGPCDRHSSSPPSTAMYPVQDPPQNDLHHPWMSIPQRTSIRIDPIVQTTCWRVWRSTIMCHLPVFLPLGTSPIGLQVDLADHWAQQGAHHLTSCTLILDILGDSTRTLPLDRWFLEEAPNGSLFGWQRTQYESQLTSPLAQTLLIVGLGGVASIWPGRKCEWE